MEIRELATQSQSLSGGSLVEAWRVSFTLPRFDLGICYFDNPLGTSADLLHLVAAGQELPASPSVRAWNSSTREKLADRPGLWVTCWGPIAQLISGSGSPNELIGLPGPPDQYNEAQFFVAPPNSTDRRDIDCVLTVTCVN